MSEEPVRNNEAEGRYELTVDGETAIAAYYVVNGVVIFTHTEVPQALEGRGIAGRLVEAALADVRARGLKIRPECSYVATYVERHADVQDLVA